MDCEKDIPTYISRQDINNFPFPYKLWLIVNSETCDFTKWNIDGTELEIKIVALDGYLSSPKSIFKIKNRSSFIDQLKSYGFEMTSQTAERISKEKEKAQTDAWPAYSEFAMNFKHENFLRHRIDLLAKLRSNHETEALQSGDAAKKPSSVADRMDGDLCFMSYGTLSQVQKCRIKYQTVLNFQTETMILQEKLHASELRSTAKGKEDDEEDTMIELPAELFENPHDSVLYMGDEHRTAYAGFYGNCSEQQILKFFGDYLPMYENVDDEEGERRIVDLNPTGRIPSAQPINFEINYSLDADTTTQSEDVQQQHSPSPPLSSALQPIFIPDEDEGEDISMDEFIKFKEQTADIPSSQPSEASKIKMEVLEEDDDNENEANFKNFFSQYRESLSLLYEKQ